MSLPKQWPFCGEMKTISEIQDIARQRGVELKRDTIRHRLRCGYQGEDVLAPPCQMEEPWVRRRQKEKRSTGIRRHTTAKGRPAVVQVTVPGWGVRC